MEEVSVVYDKDLKEEIKKFEEHSAELLKSKYLFETNTKYSLEQLRFAPQNEPIIISLREFVKAYQEQLISDSDRKDCIGMPDVLNGEDFFDNFLIEELQNRSLKFISEELLKLDRILESKRRDLHLYHSAITKSKDKHDEKNDTGIHSQSTAIQTAKRLNLTPQQRDELNGKIVDWIEKFISDGKGSQDEGFKKLSTKSKTILNHYLSAKAIEGRFTRTRKK